MSYLHTQSINVFPSTKRSNKQVSARLMTEASIVGIINKLIDKEGFVITKKEDINPQHSFEFNIFGYYFIVDSIQTLIDIDSYNDTPEVKEIYGNIIIERTGNYNELWGQDDDDTQLYSGITFSTTPLVDSTREIHSLLLLKRDTFDTEFDWYVPDESRIRFEFESISPDLDGGEI